MDDTAQHLRDMSARKGQSIHDLMIEAADEIDRLRAAAVRLHGCICPAGTEAGCGGLMCPRRAPPGVAHGVSGGSMTPAG